MSFMETGDWRIVMLIDGTDTEKLLINKSINIKMVERLVQDLGFAVIQIWNGFYYKKIERLRHGIKDIQKEKSQSSCFYCSLDLYSHSGSLCNSRTRSLGSIFSMGIWSNTNIQFWTHSRLQKFTNSQFKSSRQPKRHFSQYLWLFNFSISQPLAY